MFILLSPGLLFQVPARTRVVEFGNMYTSAISILVHAILYFCIYTILIVVVGIHIRSDFRGQRMNDWAAPIIAAALFAFLSPGLIIQMPGKNRPVDFLNMKTSVASILLHTVLFGLLLVLFLVVLNVHLY
ncbi:hypothetical protein NMG60_11026720, partial [Bertholletia excelsa]